MKAIFLLLLFISFSFSQDGTIPKHISFKIMELTQSYSGKIGGIYGIYPNFTDNNFPCCNYAPKEIFWSYDTYNFTLYDLSNIINIIEHRIQNKGLYKFVDNGDGCPRCPTFSYECKRLLIIDKKDIHLIKHIIMETILFYQI